MAPKRAKTSGKVANISASASSTIKEMSDTLYLSLWYPNLRTAALDEKLTAVLNAFAKFNGAERVHSTTVWPINWSESPVFQRIYGRHLLPGQSEPTGVTPKEAVDEGLNYFSEDFAWEFQIGWTLWEPEQEGDLDLRWVRQQRLVRVVGYGPLFDEGAYESDGHIRVELGSDTAFLEEDLELDHEGAGHVAENIVQLVALANALEKESGATARLLWSELGESLVERLAAKLGKRN